MLLRTIRSLPPGRHTLSWFDGKWYVKEITRSNRKLRVTKWSDGSVFVRHYFWDDGWSLVKLWTQLR